MWFYPHAEGAMSQHFGFGGCQGTKGEIAHLPFYTTKHTVCQCIIPFSVCPFVLKI
jgi:hypothetical protein